MYFYGYIIIIIIIHLSSYRKKITFLITLQVTVLT